VTLVVLYLQLATLYAATNLCTELGMPTFARSIEIDSILKMNYIPGQTFREKSWTQAL